MEGGRLVALPTGYRVGRYTLSAVLGEGGFGITYRARDEALRRDVAIKEYLPADVAVREQDTTIRPRTESDTRLYQWGLQRFVDEARTLAAMSAPNIVAVHDFMETNGTGYMVMELIEGRSLALILDRDGPMAADRLMPITRQLLSGLEAVHARGYLHRDIKPGNILIRPNGQPVLVDFGAARISRRSGTHAMTSVYTPGYAPAEQYAADGEQGPWTDIYALAATLYEAITGWPPPDATTRLLNDRMVPAAQAAAGKYPHSFLAGIDAGLGLRKENRPPSVAAWRAILFDEPMPADATLSATRAEFPTVIAGQRSSRSEAMAMAPPAQPAAPLPSQRQPSMREPSVRQPSLREQSPSRLSPRADPPARPARWPLIVGTLAVLLLGIGGGLLFAGGLGLFDGSEQRRLEAERRAAEERRQADLAAEAARAKAAADEAERRRIEEAAARQRAADEEAARARAAEEEARRRADEEARRRADEEARRRADEEARRRADEEARRRADEEARRRADEEARRRADEEARRRADEEARRRADEEARRAAAEEARRRAAEEEARRKAAADDPQRRAQEEARRRAEEEARARAAAEEARRRAAAEAERRRREEAARKPPPSLHAGDGRWSATASVQTHARGRVCTGSFTITGTATNGVLQASTTYGGPMVIRIGEDGLRAVTIAYDGRPVRSYGGNMRSTLVEFLDGCIYRITWTKQ
ncbi:MAG: serine/threonine protein kinase [Alphaproteobacteria bacterium]|nr:serine/threonine protein kinase [Alphaproteobacteria bacterium]MCW5742386.1 serine/threonine protein kinase [Alphaproteobacteria bacterium]